jgi:hypothetical protein
MLILKGEEFFVTLKYVMKYFRYGVPVYRKIPYSENPTY